MSSKQNKKEVLKDILRRLHGGLDVEKAKELFKDVIEDLSPAEISQAEEELIDEGMSREEIRKFCDVHIAVFKESLERQRPIASIGHPIHTLMEEHKIMLEFATDLYALSRTNEKSISSGEPKEKTQINKIIKHLKESESHYLREENVLFPTLEKHGITQPPAIMWTEHDKIRETKKTLYKHVDTRTTASPKEFRRKLTENALVLSETLQSHFYKENNILFPTALKVITTAEWNDIRKQFDEIGYCCFTPESARKPIGRVEVVAPNQRQGDTVAFAIGSLSKEEIEPLLNTLPVDITFIDKDDTVKYFSQGKDRIFVRTKAVIGRKVQHCHPEKSVHKVTQILEAFKDNREDVAEFWINLNERLIYIRYFAVRNAEQEYLGCLEVTQDITEIKSLDGEQRLLDWKI